MTILTRALQERRRILIPLGIAAVANLAYNLVAPEPSIPWAVGRWAGDRTSCP